MSYSQIMLVDSDGYVNGSLQMKNGLGTAPCIWSALCHKYSGDIFQGNPMPMMLLAWDYLFQYARQGAKFLWWEQCVLEFTYDYALVQQSNFEKFAKALRMFKAIVPGSVVCHLGVMAGEIEVCQAQAVGLYATSASDNLWEVWGEEEEPEPYNVNTGDKHWYIDVNDPDRV